MPDPITRLTAALEGRYRIEGELGIPEKGRETELMRVARRDKTRIRPAEAR